MIMLNLFAFRATDPKDMKRAADPVGPENDLAILEYTAGKFVLCAWGNHGAFLSRGVMVRALLHGRQLHYLGFTGSFQPRHPLYLPADLKPMPMPGAF